MYNMLTVLFLESCVDGLDVVFYVLVFVLQCVFHGCRFGALLLCMLILMKDVDLVNQW